MGHCKNNARGRFIAIQAYLKKQEKSQINNLTLHLKQLEKEEMKNPRVSRRKVKSESVVTQSCPTLSNPMDCSPPGSSIHGIFQARVLEWGATAFSVGNASPGQNYSECGLWTDARLLMVHYCTQQQYKLRAHI